ncbi:hypothetical protein SCP_1101670 [Sparassis crispa]|uniref:Uncharacterized protein n=1 Tax=Sparassis crispa TaxID=139825 RepID=A0A401GZB7_9APHY|nr:hypothetical protein SCP_1101670 [Sparassis crispa]GBE87490.1 hypothetical protein SCP_1101670 [Sparassis crispa]
MYANSSSAPSRDGPNEFAVDEPCEGGRAFTSLSQLWDMSRRSGGQAVVVVLSFLTSWCPALGRAKRSSGEGCVTRSLRPVSEASEEHAMAADASVLQRTSRLTFSGLSSLCETRFRLLSCCVGRRIFGSFCSSRTHDALAATCRREVGNLVLM